MCRRCSAARRRRSRPRFAPSRRPAVLPLPDAPVVVDGDALGIGRSRGSGRASSSSTTAWYRSRCRAVCAEWAALVDEASAISRTPRSRRRRQRRSARRSSHGCRRREARRARALSRRRLSRRRDASRRRQTPVGRRATRRRTAARSRRASAARRSRSAARNGTRCCGTGCRIWRTTSSSPTWNAAFVYDTEAGARRRSRSSSSPTRSCSSSATTTSCSTASWRGSTPGCSSRAGGTRCSAAATSRAARQLHSLFIDVNEITDHTENALKIVGDIYAARLFGLRRRASAWPVEGRASRTS